MSDRLLLPLFVALWASGYVVGAAAIEVADPLPLLAVRFALASLVLVPLALRPGRWRGAPLGRLAVVGCSCRSYSSAASTAGSRSACRPGSARS